MESWLRGIGCVPLNYLMEDAATAEISRSQVWQWIRHEARLSNGTPVTREGVSRMMRQELEAIRKMGVPLPALDQAAKLFEEMMVSKECPEFLTLVAYEGID